MELEIIKIYINLKLDNKFIKLFKFFAKKSNYLFI